MFSVWKNASIEKKLYFVVGIMAVLIACELVTLRFAMHNLSAVRAFVGGESLWSKAQKNAVFSLQRFGTTRDEKDYAEFLSFLEVPEGDHEARAELLKPHPDLAIVREGFLRGHIHPDDVGPVIQLLLRFSWVSYLSHAIDTWTKGDAMLFQLKEAGGAYHEAVIKGDHQQAEKLFREIAGINRDLTALEEEFSSVLGEGSRWLEYVILTILTLAVITVESIAVTLAYSTTRAISKGLSDLNTELKHSLDVRDEFMSIASHELKTPLTSLYLQLQRLERARDMDPRKISEMAGVSLRLTKRLATLLDSLLDLTRLRAGKFQINRQECDIVAIVNDVVSQSVVDATRSGSEITVVADGEVKGHYDPTRIGQIVNNLLSNAIKYGQGKPIEISVSTDGAATRVSVRDQGVGIPPEQQSRIFDRFERGRADPNIAGLGLGLYITKQIVNAHGGTIDVRSSIGEGSTFTVRI